MKIKTNLRVSTKQVAKLGETIMLNWKVESAHL